MYKHKSRCNVQIGNDLYKCNSQGIVELPDIYPQFNPLEEEKKPKKKKTTKVEE